MKALITTNYWFFGPDGRQYRAAFGKLNEEHTDTTLVTTSLGDVAIPKLATVAIIPCERVPVTDTILQ